MTIFTFGHAGDQNIHVNVMLRPMKAAYHKNLSVTLSDDDIQSAYSDLDSVIYSRVTELKGNQRHQ